MGNSDSTCRIAVASTDGLAINEHFGKAESFLIYDITAEGQTLVEKRSVIPLCDICGTSDEWPALSALADCAAVIAVKVGAPARKALAINNIDVFEHSDTIDNALAKLAAYYLKTAPFAQ